ncbi:hypothetical protein RI367_003030 [Sorochytrium milnesiophthora]
MGIAARLVYTGAMLQHLDVPATAAVILPDAGSDDEEVSKQVDDLIAAAFNFKLKHGVESPEESQREYAVQSAKLKEHVAALSKGKVSLEEVPGMGRGLIAQQPLATAEEVFCEQAYAAVMDSDCVSLYCSTCFRSREFLSPPKLMCCGKCKTVSYCSAVCQREDWKDHRAECQVLLDAEKEMQARKAVAGRPDAMYRLLSRLFRRRAREIKEGKGTAQFDLGRGLFSHRFDMAEERLKGIASGVMHLKSKLGTEESLPFDDMFDYVCRLGTNGISINTLSAELTSIGKGIYFAFAMVNHACAPNAIPIFVGSTVQLRALRPIAKGEQASFSSLLVNLLVNYCDMMQARRARQQSLKSIFCFTCTCPSCNKDTLDPFDTLRCSDKKCDGMVPAPDSSDAPPSQSEWSAECSKCHSVLKINRSEFKELVAKSQQMATTMNGQIEYKESELLLQKSRLDNVLHPHNGALFFYNRALAYHLSRRAVLQYKEGQPRDPYHKALVRLAREIYELDKAVMPPTHPLAMLAAHDMSKLIAWDLEVGCLQMPPSANRTALLKELREGVEQTVLLSAMAYKALESYYGAHPAVMAIKEVKLEQEHFLQQLLMVSAHAR